MVSVRVIVSAHPQLIHYIEREAFIQNRPGALLRPHSLREVLWQQNSDFTRQIERLGSEISSSIRELPFALPNDLSITEQDLNQPLSIELAASQQLTDQSSSKDQVSLQDSLIHQDQATSLPLPTNESTHLILSELQKQTRLLEQLLKLQHRLVSTQRITQATQGFESLRLTPLPEKNKPDQG